MNQLIWLKIGLKLVENVASLVPGRSGTAFKSSLLPHFNLMSRLLYKSTFKTSN